jgi:hypothetical protein
LNEEHRADKQHQTYRKLTGNNHALQADVGAEPRGALSFRADGDE